MPTVKVGDINIYYEIHGKGESLVMIPGTSCSVEWWYRINPLISPNYRLVLFDNRGAGRSDKPDTPYTSEMMANDLAGLLDAIGIDSAHIYGMSMGGLVAQQFALRYPLRVRSLILACTTCGGPHAVQSSIPDLLQIILHNLSLPLKERMMETLRLYMSQKFMDNNPRIIQQTVEEIMKHPCLPIVK